MKIAVLSGKGGTGKTLLSVNMAVAGDNATYIDCDVEEPNGHLFLKPKRVIKEKVTVKIPVVDRGLCNGCQKCVEFCKFNALAYINNNLMVFDNICHSCGGCVLICPEKALTEKDKIIGEVQKGVSQNVNVLSGILNIGEASGIPIIDKLLSKEPEDSQKTIIDCPPGSACIVMESIKDADYCVLIAEPTVFGVHNLSMVYELVKLFNKPHGVILNKCLDGENPAEEFCIKNNIKILYKILFDSELGTLNSNALIAARERQKYKKMFSEILGKIVEEVQHEAAVNP
ncbi:MAG: ATP-binding protein [Firmicutes bacterium]|nr:ATP-binding protein [Bacillota bacterium]